MSQTSTLKDRYLGAVLGAAVCDALGAPVEFKAPGTFPRVTDFQEGGTWGLPAGCWTDDTSMLLCLAESLIECRGFDPIDQLQRYTRWWREGHLSSIGRCFDIGAGTAAALREFERTGAAECGRPGSGGNGGLMRLLPVPLAFRQVPEQAIHLAGRSSLTTHAAPEATDAARYFAALILGALEGVSKEELLAPHFSPVPRVWEMGPLHPKIAEIAAGSFREKQPPAIRASGYCVPSLEAALWAFHSTESFEDGAIAAVNLGEDADSVACCYGEVAGAFYGVGAIPQRWLDGLVKPSLVSKFAVQLFRLSTALT